MININKNTKNNVDKEIKEFLNDFNKEHLLKENDYNERIFISNKNCLLLMELGVPIGAVRTRDINGRRIYPWMDIPREQRITTYTPINNLEDWKNYKKEYGSGGLCVHHDFLSNNEINTIAECICYIDNDDFFDAETSEKIHTDLKKSKPFDYKKIMAIFDKYYTAEVCHKFTDNGYPAYAFYKFFGVSYKGNPNLSDINNTINDDLDNFNDEDIDMEVKI